VGVTGRVRKGTCQDWSRDYSRNCSSALETVAREYIQAVELYSVDKRRVCLCWRLTGDSRGCLVPDVKKINWCRYVTARQPISVTYCYRGDVTCVAVFVSQMTRKQLQLSHETVSRDRNGQILGGKTSTVSRLMRCWSHLANIYKTSGASFVVLCSICCMILVIVFFIEPCRMCDNGLNNSPSVCVCVCVLSWSKHSTMIRRRRNFNWQETSSRSTPSPNGVIITVKVFLLLMLNIVNNSLTGETRT